MTSEQLRIIAQEVRDLAARVRAIVGGDSISFSASLDGSVWVSAATTNEPGDVTNFDPYERFVGYTAEAWEEAGNRNKETARLVEIGRAHEKMSQA